MDERKLQSGTGVWKRNGITHYLEDKWVARKGSTALDHTALNGHQGILRLLLDNGADINARTGD